MINQINDIYEKTSHEPSENGNRRPIDREFEGVIGAAIEQAVSQYHNLLRQGLDIEVKRIVEEFEKATSTIDMVIARRVRARLAELVQGEVRRVFDDTLSNAEQTLVDPIWAKARDKHLSFLSDFGQSSEE